MRFDEEEVEAAAPLARMATVSLVEVSPSMEIELKDLVTAEWSKVCKVGAAMGASVARIPSRVAMLGWIMPAPLVIPAREKVVLPWEGSVKVVEASLGKVSVVIIALAAESQEEWVLPRAEFALGMPARILSMGSRWPITPVDMTRLLGVSSGLPRVSVAVCDILLASSSPPLPVTALAQPELMIMLRMPEPFRLSSTFRDT